MVLGSLGRHWISNQNYLMPSGKRSELDEEGTPLRSSLYLSKMQLLSQIALESRQMRLKQMQERAQGGSRPLPPPVSRDGIPNQIPTSFPQRQTQRSSQPASPPWNQQLPSASSSGGSPWAGSERSSYGSKEDMEDRREQAGEMDRQRSYNMEVRQIERDSEMAPSILPFDRDPAPSSSSNVDQSPGLEQPQGGKRASVWDQIRQKSNQALGPNRSNGQQDPGSFGDMSESQADTRSQEQRAFDEMLERERKGVGAKDTWK